MTIYERFEEERNDIIPEVETAYKLCEIYGIDSGFTLEEITKADSDRLNVIYAEMDYQIEKLKELVNKVYALGNATKRLENYKDYED
jgi:hypothetical protein